MRPGHVLPEVEAAQVLPARRVHAQPDGLPARVSERTGFDCVRVKSGAAFFVCFLQNVVRLRAREIRGSLFCLDFFFTNFCCSIGNVLR